MPSNVYLFVETKRRKKGDKWDGDYCCSGFLEPFMVKLCCGMRERLQNFFDTPDKSIPPTRGLPEDVGDDVIDYLFKPAALEYDEEHRYGEYFLQSHVDRWVEEGLSFPLNRGKEIRYSDPDCHSFNWCTTDEIKACIDDVFLDKKTNTYKGDYAEWLGLHAYMKTLDDSQEYKVRAVYCICG